MSGGEFLAEWDSPDAARTVTCPVCEGTRYLNADDVTHPQHPRQTGDADDELWCIECRDTDGETRGMVTAEHAAYLPDEYRADKRREAAAVQS